MPLITTLRRHRQADLCKFNTNLVYTPGHLRLIERTCLKYPNKPKLKIPEARELAQPSNVPHSKGVSFSSPVLTYRPGSGRVRI